MIDLVADDRITCEDCRMYSDMDGRCMAGQSRYSPVSNFLRRCYEFIPHPGAENQSTGMQRWPEAKDWPGGPKNKRYPDREQK
jgi:hypothetical protein